jgi:lysophospholipase L1-like esterase
MSGDYAPTLNFKAGTYQFEGNVTETKAVNFCAASGKYTTLDANGKTITLGANFFSGTGDVYLKTSASGGAFVIQGIPAGYTGTIYVDNSIGLSVSGDLTQMGGKLNISDITLSRNSSNLGKIDVCAGATLQVVLTDREAMGSFTPSGVTLLGGTIEYVDQRGTIITTSTESVNYTKPDDYSVPAPAPTAVWVSGQFADEAELHGGYTISTTLAGSINSAGNIVIGDGAYLGAQISLPDNTYTKASVLVKFRASAGGAPAANSVIAGVFDTSEYPIGAICKTAGGTAFEGYYQAKNGTALTTGYNLSSPTISEGEGYMLFSFQSDPTSIQPATGTALYLGDSIANLTGGAYAGLQWRGYAISKLAIGGPTVATPSPWKGLEIESVALFAGEWFSPSDVEFYEFPKAEEPEYEGPDPVAVWVAGEFDDDRSAHGGLEISLNGNTTNALGQIVIGDSSSATLGATIAIPDGFDNATMLVKYEIPSGGAPAANSVPASVFVTKEMGALAGSASSELGGYWLNGSAITTGYSFSSSAPLIPLEGYLLISVPANSEQNSGDHYTAVYAGETVTTLSGGEASGLRFTGPNNRVTSVGIGGPTVAGANPWQGMVIKSVALFDEWVPTNVIANYKFPEQGAVLPEDSDLYAIEPVAKWVNDFKTTEKNGCTLSVSGTTAAKDDSFGGTLTIGDAAAIIDTTAANSANMTVLIKYRAASNVTNAPVVAFGGMGSSAGLDVGVYTKSDKTLAVYRNFSTDNGKPYDFETAPQLSATGGYVLCARDNGQQCMAYVGDSLDAMTGGTVSSGNIKFSNVTLTKLGIGGNSGMAANANDMVPFAGLEIEKVVVFSGYYTPDQIRYVPNPEDGDTLSIADGATWNFAAGTTRTYTNIGTISTNGTIAITNASELTEGTYPLATWTTPQQYTTQCAGYGKVGTLVTDGLAEGLSARLIYGARGIYLRVDDTAKQAARKPLVVWCYGDSITEGYNAQATGANYRILLYQKLEMLGYNVRSTGVYGLSNGYNSVDPSGTPLTDQYRWHSAKHGATAGPSTLCHRSNLSENVDTLAIQAGTPDVALLLIGVNDLPEFSTVEPVFKAWTNVVNRLVNNLPNTKIIVSTILNSDGSRVALDSQIADINTNYIKRIMADQPEEWQSHVFLADLNDCVKSGDPGIIYNDHLHPDWWGYDQMADGYLAAIRKCYPDPDATDFPSQNPIPAAPTVEQLGAANKPELADYRAGFTKLCNIRVEKGQDVNNVLYDDVNGNAASENLEKVGYFVEFVRADNHAHKWVWVDMDAFGDADLASVGLPQRNYQQAVTRMHVCSNHGAIDNVAADDNSVTGWIEFSPYNYDRPNNNTEAPDNYVATGKHPFDWNDTLSESGSYGCMQVFRVMNPSSKVLYERPQLMFAFNNFQSQNSNPADFGIGNFAQHFNCNNSYHTEDWTGVGGTLAKMAPDQYSVKTIEIWTKEKATDTDYPTPYSWIDMYFPELVSGWDSTQYNDFATNKNHGSVKNGYAPWESYVLGLDPTNETSKFLATIRMDGATPIVGYSPTNEVLKASGAIEYVLQGKPTLTNDWSDCLSFDEPGDTNRFFRVKVTW